MTRSVRPTRHRLRCAGLILVAMALAVRLMIPMGFMPDTRASGEPFKLVLCTAQGPVAVDADRSDPDLPDQAPARHGKNGQACAFAGQPPLAGADLALPVTSVTLGMTAGPAGVGRPALTQEPDRSAPPLPARGPPLAQA